MSIIAKYKFDKSIYENLIPEFNEGYTGYTISDEIDSENNNHIIRTMEASILPTYMRFGKTWINDEQDVIQAPRASSLLEVINLDTSALTDMNEMFRGCYNVTNISCSWNTSNVYSMVNTFEGCNKLTSLDVSNWNTSKVTSMFGTFKDCFLLTTIDVSNWNTENVLDMHKMFYDCKSLTSLDLSNWDVSNVTNMSQLFFNCQSLISLDMSNWNTSKVTNMYQMFHNCHAVKSVGNIRNFVTNKVTTIKGMFENCYVLKDIDTSNWDISNVDTMECTFEDCGSLTSLDLSDWNIKSTCVTIMMLSGCGAKTIYVYDSDYASVNRIIEQLPQVDNAELYIGGIDSLGSVNLSGARAKNWSVINKYKVAKYKFDKSIYESLIPVFNDGYTGYTISDEIDSENENHVIRTILGNSLPTKMLFGDQSEEMNGVANKSLIGIDYLNIRELTFCYRMFRNCINLEYVNQDWTGNKITDIGAMFIYCSKLTTINVRNLSTTYNSQLQYMFSGCYSLTEILGLDTWDTSNVVNMSYMFQHCTNLTSLDVSNWDTSKVTNMCAMFFNCQSLTSLDVSNFDTSKVTDMNSTFYNCHKLASLDVSNWDTSNVTNMTSMFYGCTNLTSLDVSRWNTSNVVNVNMMFAECLNLASLDVSNWDTSRIDGYQAMFFNNLAMTEIDLSGFNTVKAIDMGSFLGSMVNVKVMNLCNLNATIERVTYFDSNRFMQNCKSLEKVYINELHTLASILELNVLPDRIGKEPGQIVTPIRDQIDEEAVNNLAAKNWVVKDLVAQYRYDANTYENLLPEFNAEFTSDKYEIHDSVSDIVIDGFKWENGSIHNTSGSDVKESEENENQFFINYRKSDFVPVIGNVELNSNYRINSIIYYDESKNYIGYNVDITTTTDIILPNNTKYIRLTVHKDNTPDYDNLTLTAKLVTRSIESKNGDLPTMMRFGHNGESTDDHATYTGPATALLKVLAVNTNELTAGDRMFRYCKRVEEIHCSNWNTSNMIDMGSMFATASDCLTELDVSNFDTSNVTNMNTIFWCCFNLTSLDVSNWDTSKVTSMYGTFRGANKLNNIIGIEDWDTSNVETMEYMFAYCYNLQSLDLSKWNVDNVINMEMMLNDCTSLGLLNLSSWNMNNVTNIDNIIYGCNKLNSIIMYNSDAVSINKIINQLPTRTEASKGALVIAGVDDRTLVNVTVAESKFWIVKSILVAKYTFNKSIYDNFLPDMGTDFTSYTIIDEVSTYNANHITRMIVSDSAPQIMKFGTDGDDYTKSKALMEVMHVHMDNLRWCYNMFRGCQYATAINLKNVNTDLMTDMTCMFSMCYNITTLDVSSFNTSQITDMMYVFDDCNKLTEIKGLENWDVSNVTSFSNMFDNCRALTSLSNIYDWNVGEVTNMQQMFNNCQSLISLDLSNWDTSNVNRTDNMFCNCYSLTSLDVSNWNTSEVTRMDHMFENCQVLTSLDLSNFNTSNVHNMHYIFNGCTNLTSLDISNFNTSNVLNMEYMFSGCNKLTSVDISNFDTSNVTYMRNMFFKCYELTSLDVSNWDTGNVTNMNSMFEDCNKLTSLDVSNWDTRKVIHMINMFIRCQSLTSLDVSKWDTSNVIDMQFLFENCKSLTSLDVSNWNTGNVTNMRAAFQKCDSLTSLDLSNWDTSKVTNFNSMIRFNNKLRTVNINNLVMNSSNEPIEKLLRGDTLLDKIYVNDNFVLSHIMENIPDRTSAGTPGYIVTTIRDQIDEETIAALVAKNWQIKDLVAQYRYDANTYEDLMPEFNPEFTEDMYEVHDIVNESVITYNDTWHEDTVGNNLESDFIACLSNTTYRFIKGFGTIRWYDSNKNYISISLFSNGAYMTSPINAKYMMIVYNKENEGSNNFIELASKLVTRSIESKNGDLPASMRFGNSDWNVRELREQSLLKVIDLNGKNLTDTNCMFNNCHRLCKLNTHNLITANVTDTSLMFHECKVLKFIDADKFDMINVTNTWGMFQGCYNLPSLDVSNFNTSNVTNMGVMFSDCNNLTSLDVSNWDTSKVTNMSGMFYNCKSLTSLDVSGFDTSNVTKMDWTFEQCTSLTSLDVSNWDTSKVTYMNSLFHNCKKLTTVDVSRWNVGNVIRMDNLFNSCNELVSIDVSNWNTSNVQNMSCLFGWCSKLQSVDLSNWDTSKVVYMNYMFSECIELTSIGDTSNWDTGNVTDMSYMFQNCQSLTSLDVSKWDTSKVTTMREMFYYCERLTSLDVSNFDTRNVTDMGGMFAYCRSLTSLDVSNFDTSNVTIMDTLYNIDATSTIREGMFCNCNLLTSLDVSKWDTSKVTDMGGMFWGCSNLTSLDVSNFDTRNVTSLTNMFDDCINLTRIEGIENWIVNNVDNFNTTFNDCWKLRNLDLSRWNVKHEAQFTGTFSSNYNPFIAMNLVYLDIRNWEIDETNIHYTDKTTGEPVRRPIIDDRNTKLKYIRNDVASTVDWLVSNVLTRTADDPGYIITEAVVSNETIEAFAAKNWNVVRLADMNTVDIAIYKFDKSIYKSLVPEFDNNFADYFIDDVVEDEVNAPNIVTRTIRSMGGLPTLMRFGVSSSLGAYEDRSLSLLEVHKLNTSNITNMGQMFKRCTGVTMINTADWDVSNVTNMNELFFECAKITSLDVSNWDTRNVNNMSSIFIHCFKLQNIIGLNNWDTSNAQTMQWMFQDCQSLKSIDVSNWDTRKVNNMGSMFRYAISLESLDLSSFDTRAVTSMNCMFAGIDYGNYNPMSLTSITFGENWDTRNVTSMNAMFRGCNNLTSLDVSNWDTSNVKNMAYMFSGCNNLTSLDVSGFDTGNVTDMSFMFQYCNNLTSLDVSNFDTSNATYINTMFDKCYKLTSLDVSKWDTSKAVSLNFMFNSCESLTSLDVSNWDTSKVTLMEGMFAHCESLKELNLSNFKTDKVSNIASWMFTGLISLTSLDISNFKLNWSSDILMNVNRTIADIGMVYCDFKTVENMAKSIPTTNSTTIWVGNHIDINGLPQYDHITYKVYEVEDKLEVELSSPLLEGDRLEIIDGDLYHYHKMREFDIDGNWWFSESKTENGWTLNDNVYACYTYGNTYSNQFITDLKPKGKLLSDQFATRTADEIYITKADQEGISVKTGSSPEGCIGFRINKDRLNSVTMLEYVTKNPVHIVAELLNPYYELIKENVGLLNAEQGLYLNISDSVVPVVNHQDLCTLKLNYLLPNVEYKVKFKANNPGSIAINLGGTLVPLDVVEGWNEVMITTPETLVDEYLKVNGSEGIKIQNVMVIDSDKDFDYFKGMNNTFDEIPVKNICKNRTLTYTHGVDEEGVSPQGETNVNVNKGKVVTVLGRVSNNPDNLPISINLYNDTGRATGKNLFNKEWFEEYILEGGDQEYLDQGYIKFNYTSAYNKDFNIRYKENTQYYINAGIINFRDPDGGHANFRINIDYTDGSEQLVWGPTLSYANKTIKRIYFTYGNYGHTVYLTLDKLLIYEWKGILEPAYEPFRNYVNDEPVYIDSNNTTALVDESLVDLSATDGYFAITIKADRDYANRIGFNVGDAFACEENDQVTITDLMVFEGDILDCHPTTYVDPADTRYLVEYKSIGNPFGFGKNKLI